MDEEGDLLTRWLNPHHLRTLLLDPDRNKSTCIQIARFVAAYYLDYLLFLPADEETLPSLYLWGSIKEIDLKPTDTILDRVKVSSLMPVEYSPALPALLMVKCNSLIEAISYADHFDDRRTSLILRLLADSMHEKDLTIDLIKTMIVEGLPMQMKECSKTPKTIPKFAQNFTESILQLDVAMQNDLVIFLEQHLISTAEFVFSELPLESEEVLPNPVYEDPGDPEDSEERKAFVEIFGYVRILLESFARSNRIVEQVNFIVKLISNEVNFPAKISTSYSLHRVLLLMLRITYRHLFSSALRENNGNLGKTAERYKQLLSEDDGEHVILKNWFSEADEEEMKTAQRFIDWVQNNYHQSSSLPPLLSKTRELWLRRIVLNSTTNHRDIRQERTIDWFRSVCHPKHRVCDVVMSQMLFINSQWTSPGFTFIQPGCLALRLSIHPHDLCLGTTTAAVNYSASARDILYSPKDELSKFVEPIEGAEENKLFTRRDDSKSPDLISKYAKKHSEMAQEMSQTARYLTPVEEQLRVFTRQQDKLRMEINEEQAFLNRPQPSGDWNYGLKQAGVLRREQDANSKEMVDEALARQLNLLNERLDQVVKSLEDRQKTMYIREEDEESEMSDLPPLQYDDAPVTDQASFVIEKLNFELLSNRTPVPVGDYNGMKTGDSCLLAEIGAKIQLDETTSMSTAKSFSNPLFTEKHPKIPIEWMKLLPLEAGSARYADNLLTYNKIGNGTEKLLCNVHETVGSTGRNAVTERGIGIQTSNSPRIAETQTTLPRALPGENELHKKSIDLKAVRKLSIEDIKEIIDRVKKC